MLKHGIARLSMVVENTENTEGGLFTVLEIFYRAMESWLSYFTPKQNFVC
jgi:hypothetical protein